MQDKRKSTPPPLLHPNDGDAPPETPPPRPQVPRGDDWPAPFRATFLLVVPHDLASPLRRVGGVLADEALEHFGIAPDSPPESKGGPPLFREMLAAVAADLRHLEGFIREEIVRAAETGDGFTLEDLQAARLAGVLAPRIGTIAAAIESEAGEVGR